MCHTPGIFDNIFRWHFFSGKRYFIYMLWAQAYNNNTLLLAAIIYMNKTNKTKQEQIYGKVN